MLETGTWETMRCRLGWQPSQFEPGSVSGTGNPWGGSAPCSTVLQSVQCGRHFQHLFQPFRSDWHVQLSTDQMTCEDIVLPFLDLLSLKRSSSKMGRGSQTPPRHRLDPWPSCGAGTSSPDETGFTWIQHLTNHLLWWVSAPKTQPGIVNHTIFNKSWSSHPVAHVKNLVKILTP